MYFFQIIRWKNLVMIAFIQGLVKYFLLPLFKFPDILNNAQFVLLVIASVFIAAGGYIINDIYDLETDQINKPSKVWISKYFDIKKAKLAYTLITFFGILFGLVVSLTTENHFGFVLFLLPVFLLYLYAIWAKRVLILGNLLVSFLIVYSLVILVFFEKISLKINDTEILTISSVIWSLLFFAFILNMTREIVKDMEDREGDTYIGAVSIPIKYGMGITKLITSLLIGIIFLFIAYFGLHLYELQPLLVVYLIFVVLGSFIFFLSQLCKAKNSADFGKLSSYLKVIMIVGMLAVFFIKPN